MLARIKQTRMPRRTCNDADALASLRGATLRTLLEEHGEKGVAGCSKREALERIADSKMQRQIVAAGLLILAELEHANPCDDSSSDDTEGDTAESDDTDEDEDEDCEQQAPVAGKRRRRR